MSERKRTQPALSWDDLRFFLMLARTGQLTEAARQLGTSHVTVSRRIDRLEVALSQKLFSRTAKGYDLAHAGRKLVETAERMEAAAEGLPSGSAEGAGLTGTFRLAMPEAFGAYFSDNLLPEFKRRFPHIILEMITSTQIISLSRREADLSVTVDPVDKGPYRSVKLLDYDLGIYAAGSYLKTSAPICSREDLTEHTFISYIEGMIYSPGLDYLDEVHAAIRPVIKGASIFNQLSATRNGLGLCVLPCYVAQHFSDLVPVLNDQIILKRGYWLTGHRDTTMMRRERTISQFIRAELEQRSLEFRVAADQREESRNTKV